MQMHMHTTSKPFTGYLHERGLTLGLHAQKGLLSLDGLFAEGRWRTAVVVTSRFHQLRSYLTFRCAVRQRMPHARQLQARPQRASTAGWSHRLDCWSAVGAYLIPQEAPAAARESRECLPQAQLASRGMLLLMKAR